MSRFAFLTLAFALSKVAYCQDYLITAKGDTLRGKINIATYDIIDRAEIKANKKKTSLTATQVREVVIGGAIYRPQKHNDRYRFMKLLKPGFLSLYGFRAEGQTAFDSEFLVMLDGRSTEVPHLSFRTVMSRFLKDCPELADRVEKGEDGKLGKKDVEKIIDEYNSCIDQKKSYQPNIVNADPELTSQLQHLEELKKKVTASADLPNKQDALDLMKDIEAKLKSNQAVPNYLITGLQGYLGSTDLKPDLDKFVEALDKN